MGEEYKDILENVPVELKSKLSPKTLDNVFKALDDPAYCSALRDNFVSFSSVVNHSRYSVEQYFNACKFLTYKGFGFNDIISYQKTFPDRYYSLLGKGKDNRSISSYVSAFKNSALVTAIREHCSIKDWVYNLDRREDAIAVLHEIVLDDKASHRARINAADALLNHTAPPPENKLTVEVGISKTSAITLLDNRLNEIVKQQKEMLCKGESLNKVINGTGLSLAPHVEDVDEDE